MYVCLCVSVCVCVFMSVCRLLMCVCEYDCVSGYDCEFVCNYVGVGECVRYAGGMKLKTRRFI